MQGYGRYNILLLLHKLPVEIVRYIFEILDVPRRSALAAKARRALRLYWLQSRLVFHWLMRPRLAMMGYEIYMRMLYSDLAKRQTLDIYNYHMNKVIS